MLVLKGAFVSILLFVVVTALYVTIPRTAAQAQGIRHMGPAQFPVDFLHRAGMLTLGFGVGGILTGAGFLWVHQLAHAHLNRLTQNIR